VTELREVSVAASTNSFVNSRDEKKCLLLNCAVVHSRKQGSTFSLDLKNETNTVLEDYSKFAPRSGNMRQRRKQQKRSSCVPCLPKRQEDCHLEHKMDADAKSLNTAQRQVTRRSSDISMHFVKRIWDEVSLEAMSSVTESAFSLWSGTLTALLFDGGIPLLGIVQGVRNMKKSVSLFALAAEVGRQGKNMKECLPGDEGRHAKEVANIKASKLRMHGMLKAKEGVWQIVGQIPGMSLFSIPMIVACEVSASVVENAHFPPLVVV
jgi:hypothetical protein